MRVLVADYHVGSHTHMLYALVLQERETPVPSLTSDDALNLYCMFLKI